MFRNSSSLKAGKLATAEGPLLVLRPQQDLELKSRQVDGFTSHENEGKSLWFGGSVNMVIPLS